MLILTVKEQLSDEFRDIVRRIGDMSPAMNKIEGAVMKTVLRSAWGRSGLHSRTGELRNSIRAWHGKTSVGISLKTRPGHDKVLLKAHTHLKGRAKWAGDDKGVNKKHKVREYSRAGKKVSKHMRLMRAPWGKIPSRPFFPVQSDFGGSQMELIRTIIISHITSLTGGKR